MKQIWKELIHSRWTISGHQTWKASRTHDKHNKKQKLGKKWRLKHSQHSFHFMCRYCVWQFLTTTTMCHRIALLVIITLFLLVVWVLTNTYQRWTSNRLPSIRDYSLLNRQFCTLSFLYSFVPAFSIFFFYYLYENFQASCQHSTKQH